MIPEMSLCVAFAFVRISNPRFVVFGTCRALDIIWVGWHIVVGCCIWRVT